MKTKRGYRLKSFSVNTCKLEILKKVVDNQNLDKKVVFIVLIYTPTTIFDLIMISVCRSPGFSFTSLENSSLRLIITPETLQAINQYSRL